MTVDRDSTIILMADDDDDDYFLVRDALAGTRLANDLRRVSNGVELMEYLRRQGRYADAALSPRPGVILLDLNMPLMDGREVLEQLKSAPDLRRIPVVVMTTSQAEEDVSGSYDRGASSFIVKPVTFDELVRVMQSLGDYWIETVRLPAHE
ncbi:MAG TPA: response regulator [Longimicrobium sp.]|nr:response regulator [Longimicrobium sp.]